MTCSHFKEVFFKRYFPASTRDAKADEFFVLTQGDMTVQGYVVWYIELSRFAPCLILNEYEKARSVIEIGIREDEVDQESKKRPVSSGSRQGSWKKRNQGLGYHQNTECHGSQVDQSPDHCIMCHRWHDGECQLFGGNCYSCGRSGHLARDCRAPKRDTLASSVNWGSNQITQGTIQANTAPTRVYSLTPTDADRARNEDIRRLPSGNPGKVAIGESYGV
ncbi:uncharacterized protein LOC131158685 [Malania oleifera]|uniref:uncharacterized protein LOC131158685 n=1 Tax=Malania oleifera TaxID=397392 RepID=UPI0025AEA9BB|nr:uncharacterized protein LOC131158685 [Malania oleifera]